MEESFLPFKAQCGNCEEVIRGKDLPELYRLMIEHHNKKRRKGWIGGGCGVFYVEEIDDEGKSRIGTEGWLMATMNVIVTPGGEKVIYDPNREK